MANTAPAAGLRHKSLWDASRHGQQIRGVGLTPMASISFTGPNVAAGGGAASNQFLFAGSSYALAGEWRPVLCRVVSSGAFAPHPLGSVIQVRNIGTAGLGADDLSAGGFNNVTTAIAANVPFTVPIESEGNASPTSAFMGENEVLVLRFGLTGAGRNYSGAVFHVTLYGIQSPPGRAAFQQ